MANNYRSLWPPSKRELEWMNLGLQLGLALGLGLVKKEIEWMFLGRLVTYIIPA